MASLTPRNLRIVARPIPGVALLTSDARRDERGWFARCFCRAELRELGIDRPVEQANMSSSLRRGTLRGLHYQLPPSAETKLVSCLQGSVYDVVLDLRPDSPTYTQHFGAELSAGNRRVMVVPEGCAHGFLTLEDSALILYFVSTPYDPVRERGIRWDDPTFAIDWPFAPEVVSDRDHAHPLFVPDWHRAA
jgi:dTDP-4-dehydrorhamnose 3,5-epimerase